MSRQLAEIEGYWIWDGLGSLDGIRGSVFPLKKSGCRSRVNNMRISPKARMPMPNRNTVPIPKTDEPDPYAGSKESNAVMKNMMSKNPPPRRGKTNLKIMLCTEANNSFLKYQMQAMAVIP